MENTFVFEKELKNFVSLASLESTQAFDELVRHELVVLHAHLHSCQHSEVVLGQILN